MLLLHLFTCIMCRSLILLQCDNDCGVMREFKRVFCYFKKIKKKLCYYLQIHQFTIELSTNGIGQCNA